MSKENKTLEIKEAPKAIYLLVSEALEEFQVLNEEDEYVLPFTEISLSKLGDVCWCQDRFGEQDIRYVHESELTKLNAEIAESRAENERLKAKLEMMSGNLTYKKAADLIEMCHEEGEKSAE